VSDPGRNGVGLGVREDLGADCARCVGLCCVALAFAPSADFPVDKPAGVPCLHLAEDDGCRIHAELRPRGYRGCTVFDCFGAGQKVTAHTFGGRSWRDDPTVRDEMMAVFPVVRRLHELLWYLDRALALPDPDAELETAFARVKRLSDATPAALRALDVDAEYAAARPLLLAASERARAGARPAGAAVPAGVGPGRDLSGARLAGADLRGLTLRGALLIAADLAGARLDRCDLLGVDLRDADLSGADLGGAVYLTQGQVDSARGDARTGLPPGFTRPGHWS
jgi:hypothetical protein